MEGRREEEWRDGGAVDLAKYKNLDSFLIPLFVLFVFYSKRKKQHGGKKTWRKMKTEKFILQKFYCCSMLIIMIISTFRNV